MTATITTAINERRILHLYHNGTPKVIEPYLFGITNSGIELLYCYQVSSRIHHLDFGWRLFDVEELHEIKLSKGGFEVRNDIDEQSRSFVDTIYAEYTHDELVEF